jgi:uncharacterized lipoprotein YddW (UPF0748 family)
MPRKKTEKVMSEQVTEHMKRVEEIIKADEPVITSITINPNGTIFGLADNKVFVYDDLSKTWKQR